MINEKITEASWWWLHAHERMNGRTHPRLQKSRRFTHEWVFRHCRCSRPTYNREHERAFGEDDRSRSAVPCGHKGYSLDWRDTVLLLRRMDWHFRPLWPQGFFSRASHWVPNCLFTLLTLVHANFNILLQYRWKNPNDESRKIVTTGRERLN